MIDDASVLTRSTTALTAEVDGETVMFDPGKGSYFALGEVGSRVWELLETPCSIDGLCAALLAEFAVEEDRCRGDIRAYVEQLRAAELVEPRS
jgi:hypothetical protein